MRLVDVEEGEVRLPARGAAGVVVEQCVAHTLKRSELENSNEVGAEWFEIRAIRAVAELGDLRIEVAVDAQPEMRSGDRLANRLCCDVVVLNDSEAILVANQSKPRIRQVQQRETCNVSGLESYAIQLRGC